MTKKQIFDKIIEVTAEVCNVTSDDIIGGCRREDCVVARGIAVFWLKAAGFSVESMLKCVLRNHANSIKYVQDKIDEMWVDRFAFHMLCREVGKRLLDIAHSIGEDFDMERPLKQIAKQTGKY